MSVVHKLSTRFNPSKMLNASVRGGSHTRSRSYKRCQETVLGIAQGAGLETGVPALVQFASTNTIAQLVDPIDHVSALECYSSSTFTPLTDRLLVQRVRHSVAAETAMDTPTEKETTSMIGIR
jgi:hypothetical protein